DAPEGYSGKLLYVFSEPTVTPEQLITAQNRGYEIVFAPLEVKNLLGDLGRSEGIEVEDVSKLLADDEPDVPQSFQVLRARLTPFLNEKDVGDIEFHNTPEELARP